MHVYHRASIWEYAGLLLSLDHEYKCKSSFNECILCCNYLTNDNFIFAKISFLIVYLLLGFSVFNNMRTLFNQHIVSTGKPVYGFRCCQSPKRTSQETDIHFSRVEITSFSCDW